MKSKNLERSIREAAHHNRTMVFAPGERTRRSWPLCLTCGREVDAAEIKNVNSTSCEIWARHHGKEDFYKVTWDVPVLKSTDEILEDLNVGWAIKRAMADGTFFNPSIA